MLPSYTKPSIQSVQPGAPAPAAPATATGYAVGANPITASRGAVADLTKAPAMPANPQVQSQPGIPQAWQSPYYMQNMQNMQSYFNARPEMAGLGSLPPSIHGQMQAAAPAQMNAAAFNDPAANADQQGMNTWRMPKRSMAGVTRENTPMMSSTPAFTNTGANQAALQNKNAAFWDNAKANYSRVTAPPKPATAPARAAPAPVAKPVRRGPVSREDRGGNDNGMAGARRMLAMRRR